MENLQQALLILVVGMITVFCILFLIVAAGQLLIRLTNMNFADGVKSERKKQGSTIEAKKLAAVTATVAHMTGGLGEIERIQRIKS